MFAGFTQRLNFGMGGGTVSVPSAFPTRPIGQLGNFNTYAINFITATGITASNQQSAINQLSYDLVNTGLMDKMVAIYPFVGGNATTHSFNLKDPRDANAAFRLIFGGGMTHSSTGIQFGGVNGIALTYLNGLGNLPQTNMHISAYSRTVTVGTQYEVSLDNGSQFQQLRIANSFFSGNATVNQGGVSFTTTNTAQGYWIGSKTNTSTRFLFRNGVLNSSVTTFNDVSASPNLQFSIGARNLNGVAQNGTYTAKELAFVTIGLGLSQAECITLSTIVATFQTTLGRNV
jgi:hypothetical protein